MTKPGVILACAMLACACAAGGEEKVAINETDGWRFEPEPSIYDSRGRPVDPAKEADTHTVTLCERVAPTGSRLPEVRCRTSTRGGLDEVKQTIDSLVEESNANAM